jgi:hypothetical protein
MIFGKKPSNRLLASLMRQANFRAFVHLWMTANIRCGSSPKPGIDRNHRRPPKMALNQAALSPMNELAVNLTAKRVDYGYLKVLIVS